MTACHVAGNYNPAKKTAAAPTAPAATHWTPKLLAAPVKVEGLAEVTAVTLLAAVVLAAGAGAGTGALVGVCGWPSVIWETALAVMVAMALPPCGCPSEI